jgi:hypothetical protein
VHVDGDDAAGGAIYRDASANLPPSRRPKEYLEFGDDGTVRKLATGPDDRAQEIDRTRWSPKDANPSFTFASPDARGATRYRVVEQGAQHIVVHRS